MTDTDQAHEARPTTPIDAIAETWVDTELDLFPEYRVYLGRAGHEGEYADYSPEARVSTPTTRQRAPSA